MVRRTRSRIQNRKGTALVLAVALMFALFSFLAFGVDIGFVAQSEAEMQRTADAAAMAGCWELHSQMELGSEDAVSYYAARQVAADFAELNPVNRSGPVLNRQNSEDIQIGYLASLDSTTLSNDPSDPYFAVRVNVTKNAEKNGQVPYFFARIFGNTGQDMFASATATMSRNVSGFYLPPDSSARLDILPFALDEDTWEELLEGNASDNYSFDAESGSVTNGSDGILEVNLFPQGTGAPGNRGTVDIGGNNNSTNDIKRQITDGISAQDLIDLGKPLVLNNGTMTLNGDTGISAGVKSPLQSIVGEKRVIPLFSSVSGNGNNATYTITKWVGVRVLYVKLTGPMKHKRVMVQPAPMLSPYAVTNTSGSSSSDFVLTPVVLAR